MLTFALLGATEYEGETVLGIYSSYERAFNARIAFEEKMGENYFDEYRIMEYTLDAKAFEIKE